MSKENSVPFEHVVNVRTLPKKGRHFSYIAPEEVLQKIARFYDLISVEHFEASAVVSPWKRDGVHLKGNVSAKLIQHCAVSHEPLAASVDEPVEIVFVPEGSKLSKPRTNQEGEWVFDAEGDDLPEPFSGDSIDIGATWLEFFAMGIDPYAKLEGAELAGDGAQDGSSSDNDKINPESPFAALANWKKD